MKNIAITECCECERQVEFDADAFDEHKADWIICDACAGPEPADADQLTLDEYFDETRAVFFDDYDHAYEQAS